MLDLGGQVVIVTEVAYGFGIAINLTLGREGEASAAP